MLEFDRPTSQQKQELEKESQQTEILHYSDFAGYTFDHQTSNGSQDGNP